MRGNERNLGAFRCNEGLGGRVPRIKSNIEERIRNMPEANRERPFINAAKTEAMSKRVRPVGDGVHP